MDRAEMIARLHAHRGPWDVVVIGGGATGMGIAVDAATRGYSTLLLEQHDFGKGTSSRSTKLVHGGVRYLEKGNIPLVMEALRERGRLLRNAPHLVRELAFVVPAYRWWERPFYGAGLKFYNVLAGREAFGKSRILNRPETIGRLPGIRMDGLRGGVLYFDAQFDDARLLIHLALTAAAAGATLLNYARVVEVSRNGAAFRDGETGETSSAAARVVINAAGPFSDAVRRLADSAAAPTIAPSQGVHLVFDRSFLPGDAALMVPHTSDGRVLFAIPWHSHTLVGTTDTAVAAPTLEPRALEPEIAFLLATAGAYLAKPPTRSDILSMFAGIRPLVRGRSAAASAALSRDHTIRRERSGLLSIAGGKWTTYRRMAEDCVDRAAVLGNLPSRPSVTRDLPVHGWTAAGGVAPLHPALPYTAADIVRGVRQEMARTVEDALARRTRALFLNARAAMAMAPETAHLLAVELERDAAWEAAQVESFGALAGNYLPTAPLADAL